MDDLHWFGVASEPKLCAGCWEASTCPKEFGYRPDHLDKKNLLGLKRVFLNSLRLTWTMVWLADAAGLLRALALLSNPTSTSPLQARLPRQLSWQWENEAAAGES